MLNFDFSEGLTPYLERILDVAGNVAPDLQGPAYIISMELPGKRGLYVPGLDRVFRREIEAAGKWRGRGPCVAVDRGEIYTQAFAIGRSEGLDERQSDRLARLELTGVVLHELAHVIDKNNDEEEAILSDGPEIARKAFDNFLHNEPLPERSAVASPVVPWHGHDLHFVRCCAILHSRVVPDLPLRLSDIVETGRYGLSPARTYAAAAQVDGDLDYADCTPIRAILDTPPGDILRAKWRQDVIGWFRQSPMGDTETKAAEESLALCNGRRAKAEAVPVAAATDDYLPQPNEHFVEVRPTPEAWQHDSFEPVDVADGVRRLDARLRDGPDDSLRPATFYFADDKFTVPEAESWLHRRRIVFARVTASKNSMYPQLTS
jgi:hypothetical protein